MNNTNKDIVDFIIDFESGNLSDSEIIEFFQHLLNTGTINGLQGTYQRLANSLLEAGLISK